MPNNRAFPQVKNGLTLTEHPGWPLKWPGKMG
jgi:hypothetical protein